MNRIIIYTAILFLSACSSTSTKVAQPTVSVSVMPQKFFVDKIAGPWLKVNVMVPVGASPATYEPTPIQMRNLSDSKAYFEIGHLGFEKAWMDKFVSLNPKMKVVDTSKDMDLIEEEEDHHSHGHKHEGYNPHTWLSPKLVKMQAQEICNTLCKIFPASSDAMQQNLNRFILQVDSTNIVLMHQLKEKRGTSFIVYHPVWNYLARDFGLNQVAIERNGKEASAMEMKQIIDFANGNSIRIIFAQKEFNAAQAQSIANEINGKVVLLDPLGYNWFNIINEFGEVFSVEVE